MKESKMSNGRIAVYLPDHPKANNRGYVLRARYIMEKKLGRLLSKEEHVHHINGNKLDDREDNLQILSCSEHAKLHIKTNPKFQSTRKLDYDLVLKLRKENKGYKAIAKITGYPRSSVQRACKSMGM